MAAEPECCLNDSRVESGPRLIWLPAVYPGLPCPQPGGGIIRLGAESALRRFEMSTPTPLPSTDPGAGPPAAEKVPDELFDPARRAPAPISRPSRSNIAACALILFGVLFLIATVVPIGGGVFLLGLGLAFLVARLTTGRYGYAVPAGILTGLGIFVTLQEAGALS